MRSGGRRFAVWEQSSDTWHPDVALAKIAVMYLGFHVAAVLNLCHACAGLEDFVLCGLGRSRGFAGLVGHGGRGWWWWWFFFFSKVGW